MLQIINVYVNTLYRYSYFTRKILRNYISYIGYFFATPIDIACYVVALTFCSSFSREDTHPGRDSSPSDCCYCHSASRVAQTCWAASCGDSEVLTWHWNQLHVSNTNSRHFDIWEWEIAVQILTFKIAVEVPFFVYDMIAADNLFSLHSDDCYDEIFFPSGEFCNVNNM